jgi:hypothetical protein
MYKQTLYKILDNIIPEKVLKSYNKYKKWEYGYNKEFDIIIISKDGTIDEVYEIQNLKIALPKKQNVYNFEKDYWDKLNFPKELSRIKNVFEWEKYPDNFKEEKKVFGLITKVFLLILLVLTTCTCAGRRLMLGSQTLENQIDYSIYSGKLVRQMQDHMGCVILRTDDQAFHLCPHQNSCIQLPPHVTHVTEYCQKLGQMLRRCLPTRSYRYRSTIPSFSNPSRTVWTDRKPNLPIESQPPNSPERNLTPIKPPQNWKALIPPLTGKTQGTTPTMVKN